MNVRLRPGGRSWTARKTNVHCSGGPTGVLCPARGAPRTLTLASHVDFHPQAFPAESGAAPGPWGHRDTEEGSFEEKSQKSGKPVT